MDDSINNGSAFTNESDINVSGFGETDLFAGFDEGTSAETETVDTTTVEESTESETASEPIEESTNNPIKFTAKIDHQEQEISINETDIPVIYQQAMNQQRSVAKLESASKENADLRGVLSDVAELARTMGLEGESDTAIVKAMIDKVNTDTLNARVDQLVKKGTAKDVALVVAKQEAKDAAEKRMVSTEVTTESDNTIDPAVQADIRMLWELRPELKSGGIDMIPQEVFDNADKIGNITAAYLDWESKQKAAEAKTTAKDNKVLRQNQASANKAPVRGVSGKGSVNMSDDFLAGWDDPLW